MKCWKDDEVCPMCDEHYVWGQRVVTTEETWDALQAVVGAARNMHPAGGEQELIAALDALDALGEE